MQLHSDFTRQSENQQMTQHLYNNPELQESVFLPKIPNTLGSTHHWQTPLFPTLLINSPVFWRLVTLATLQSQGQWGVPSTLRVAPVQPMLPSHPLFHLTLAALGFFTVRKI